MTQASPIDITLTGFFSARDLASDYRYGFNGMEKDDEVSGSGNSYTAEFWQYDSRLGRRWNTDPIVKPWESPYACFYNMPVRIIDPNGDDGYLDEDGNYLGDDGDKESHNTRVINKDTWNSTVGETKTGDFTDELRKTLQTNVTVDDNNNVTGGTSKLLQEYEKGIKISDDTWKKLVANGGTKLTPFVTNNSNETVFYKPDGMSKGDNPVNLNPYVNASGAYPIAPHTDLYSPVDGVNTTQVDYGEVFKIPDGRRVVISKKGVPDLINWIDITPGIGEISPPDAGWKELERSVPKSKPWWHFGN